MEGHVSKHHRILILQMESSVIAINITQTYVNAYLPFQTRAQITSVFNA